jgi:histidinol dehydrogenase
VLKTTDLRGSATDPRTVLPRAAVDIGAAAERIQPILDDVRDRGLPAVLAATQRFDGVELTDVRVPKEHLEAALETLDPALRAALETSIQRARAVHADQRRQDVTTRLAAGGTVTERWVPVERVGLYVPGGLAALVSTVGMNVVPAQEAGVTSLAVASPPQREYGGRVHPSILAACALLGVEEVYAVGGAQAVAMFAYGIENVRPVDMVTGPGNIYVTAAKRQLRGVVGIDSEAGTTEIAILADHTADPVHVAADLISQAEHDPAAASVLVTDSPELLDEVQRTLPKLVGATRHSERVTEALTGPQSGAILVDDVEHGLRVVDAYAAEHLEIQTVDARAVALRVRNAGAIFIGPYAPVSLGDYCAGSNHVLPTGGCARHSSGLSVQTFLRGIHLIEYDEPSLAEVAGHVVALANAEDLPAHGEAVQARFR